MIYSPHDLKTKNSTHERSYKRTCGNPLPSKPHILSPAPKTLHTTPKTLNPVYTSKEGLTAGDLMVRLEFRGLLYYIARTLREHYY